MNKLIERAQELIKLFSHKENELKKLYGKDEFQKVKIRVLKLELLVSLQLLILKSGKEKQYKNAIRSMINKTYNDIDVINSTRDAMKFAIVRFYANNGIRELKKVDLKNRYYEDAKRALEELEHNKDYCVMKFPKQNFWW